VAEPRSIEIIIPVKSMAAHLDKCLAAVTPQLGAGDRVTVVDDGSADRTAQVAFEAGARVLALAESRGPYAARNHAARRSTADALLFIDARCRPLPGWLATHRELLGQDGAALSCTNVAVLRGQSLASQIAYVQEPFQITTRIGIRGRWDWYPTANLGVDRRAFEVVAGFSEIRSGGDEDLCRRIQQCGLGRMAANFDTFMQWEPRDSLKELGRQCYRYGKGSVMLQARLGTPGPMTGRAPARTTETVKRLARHAVRVPPDAPAVLGAFGMQAMFLAGRFMAAHHPDSTVVPVQAAVGGQ
jgi:hypothetical protein